MLPFCMLAVHLERVWLSAARPAWAVPWQDTHGVHLPVQVAKDHAARPAPVPPLGDAVQLKVASEATE